MAIAIPGYAAQVSVRAGSVIAHLASLNTDGPKATELQEHFNATDLMMLDARDMRVAARVRRPGFASRYPNEFTIRSKVASGAETEISKIMAKATRCSTAMPTPLRRASSTGL